MIPLICALDNVAPFNVEFACIASYNACQCLTFEIEYDERRNIEILTTGGGKIITIRELRN